MGSTLFVCIIAGLTFAAYRCGMARVRHGAKERPHSLLVYYGYYAALCCSGPAFAVFCLWLFFEPLVVTHLVLAELPQRSAGMDSFLIERIRALAESPAQREGVDPSLRAALTYYVSLKTVGWAGLVVSVLGVMAFGFRHAMKVIGPDFRARNHVESILRFGLLISSMVAIVTTLGIVLSLIFETVRFFTLVSPTEFLFGLHWSPQTALRTDQVASEGSFGAVPLFAGTLLITAIAMVVATPIALMSAIYMSQYASAGVRQVVKPALEILAGIPTVVYGFFAALTVAPLLREAGVSLGLDVASESALAAGLVMGIMIIPFISSLSDDVITAVPQSLRNGSYALGATPSETMRLVVFPAALPGIAGAFLLAVSRAIGETMIVVMAAGLAANLTANPLEAVTTVTVQIVTLLVGDQEFDSAKTLAAFALGIVLFLVTLSLNALALKIIQRYREKYD